MISSHSGTTSNSSSGPDMTNSLGTVTFTSTALTLTSTGTCVYGSIQTGIGSGVVTGGSVGAIETLEAFEQFVPFRHVSLVRFASCKRRAYSSGRGVVRSLTSVQITDKLKVTLS